MTVYIEKPSLNLREELASLRNQGGYQEQQFYFDSLVTNGTFDADTNWTKGTGWTISGGVATHAQASGGGEIYQNISGLTVGGVYAVLFTVDATGDASISNSSVGIMNAGNTAYLVSSAVTGGVSNIYALTFTATADTHRARAYSADDISIDNVSVFETDGTDVVHRMPKGWVPLHVYEDGLLQREGAANDYEVVYDGFDYYVKPAVAPSATTQTCVIGVRK